MFQFQAVNSVCICFFDIEIQKIIIENIPDFDAEGLGIAESAIIH